MDERGHAHITDFNIAVHYTDRRLLTGVAGSMAYMGQTIHSFALHILKGHLAFAAPEILAKKGYSYMIDWWSLGVCAFELIFGRRPFRGKTNSDLTHAISRDPLRFPEDSDSKCSKEGKSALKDVRLCRYNLNPSLIPGMQLLNRNWDQRLGSNPNSDGEKDFRHHPWFQKVDWVALESKEVMPPFVPDVRAISRSLSRRLTLSQSKKANFDSTHELEELLLEDNPLKARKRKANQDIDNLSAEMRQMEEQ